MPAGPGCGSFLQRVSWCLGLHSSRLASLPLLLILVFACCALVIETPFTARRSAEMWAFADFCG
jgi:hypothetical protein